MNSYSNSYCTQTCCFDLNDIKQRLDKLIFAGLPHGIRMPAANDYIHEEDVIYHTIQCDDTQRTENIVRVEGNKKSYLIIAGVALKRNGPLELEQDLQRMGSFISEVVSCLHETKTDSVFVYKGPYLKKVQYDFSAVVEVSFHFTFCSYVQKEGLT